MSPIDDTLAPLRPYVDRGRHGYRNRAVGLYLGALVVLGVTVAIAGADFYRAGPMILVVMLALAGLGFHLWYRRLDWTRNAVLLARAQRPEEIVAAQVLGAEGRTALLDERQVEIRTRDAAILLTVPRGDLAPLHDALVAHCPACRAHGFPGTSDDP